MFRNEMKTKNDGKLSEKETAIFGKKSFKKTKKSSIAFAILPLAACGGGGGNSPADDTPPAPDPDYTEAPTGTFIAVSDVVDPTLDQAAATTDLTVIGNDTDDTITTGSGADKIRAGVGADNITAGSGDDAIVVVGTTTAAQYTNAAITDSGGTGMNLSSLITLADLNGRSVSEASSGEVIDGGAGVNTLYIYGTVDLTGVTLNNVTVLVVNSDVTLTPEQIAQFTTVDGDGNSVINIEIPEGSTDNYILDLSAMDVTDIGSINISGDITVVIDDAADVAGIAAITIETGSDLTLEVTGTGGDTDVDLGVLADTFEDIAVIEIADDVTLVVVDPADITDLGLTEVTGDGEIDTDGSAAADTALDDITVAPTINSAPVAVNDDGQGITSIFEGGTAYRNISYNLLNDSDPDGDPLSIISASVPDGKGTITMLGDSTTGVIQFDAGDDFEYLDDGETENVVVTYILSDGDTTDEGTYTYVVKGQNDNPAVGSVTLPTTNEDTAIIITKADLLANSTDVDGDNLTITYVGVLDINSGAFVDNGNDTFTYTPAENYNGNTTLRFTVSDGSVNVAGQATIDVTAVNDDPIGTVTITGTATEFETLTAGNTLTDDDGLGSITYQWQKDGVDVDGATTNQYTLAQADTGAVFTVTASYTDLEGTPESVTSAPTSSVIDLDTSATLSQVGKVQMYEPLQGDKHPTLYSPIKTELANGDYILTTSKFYNTTGTTGSIGYMQIFNADHTPDGAAFTIDHLDIGSQFVFFQTIADDAGGFTAFWREHDNTNGNYIGIIAQKFDASGAKVGGEVTLKALTGNNADTYVDLAVIKGENDGYIITFTEKDLTGADDLNTISSQAVNADLTLDGAQYLISQDTNGYYNIGGIDLVDGGYVIYAVETTTKDLLVVTVAADNSSTTTVIPGLTNAGLEFNAGVALEGGGFAIAYTLDNAGDAGLSDLVIQEFDVNGAAIGAPLIVMEGIMVGGDVSESGVYDVEYLSFVSMDIHADGTYVIGAHTTKSGDGGVIESKHSGIGNIVVDPDSWTTPLTDFSTFTDNDSRVFGHIYADDDGGSSYYARNLGQTDEVGQYVSLFMVQYDADGNIINDESRTALESDLDVIYNGNANGSWVEHGDGDLVNLFPNMSTDGLAITDIDITTVQEVRIEFTDGFIDTEDMLGYLDANNTIDGTLDANGVLILTATAGGDLSIVDAEAAINSLYYQNIEAGGNQTEGIRELSITVVNTDGTSAAPVTYNLNVKVNDIETFNVSEGIIDGGHLSDTVVIDLANIDLSDATNSSKITNVEKFDMTGNGANTLSLGYDDLLAMTGPFETGNSNQRVDIYGEAGDVVNLVGTEWQTVNEGGFSSFLTYRNTDFDIRIDNTVTVNMVDSLDDLDTSATLSQTGRVQMFDDFQGDPAPVMLSPVRTDLANGQYVVTVSKPHPTEGGNGYVAEMQIFNADGTPSSSMLYINHQDTGGKIGYAQAIANDDGGFTVFWLENNVATNTYEGIYAQEFNASGAKVGGEVLITSITAVTSATQSQFTVTSDVNDGYVVVYSEKLKSDPWGFDLTAQKVNNDLSLNGAETVILSNTNTYVAIGDIALTDGGYAIYLYDQFNLNVDVVTVGADGVVDNIVSITNFSDNTEFNQGVALANGGFAILYTQQNANDATHSDLVIQEFTASGALDGAPIIVLEDILARNDSNDLGNPDLETLFYYSMDINADGEYLVSAANVKSGDYASPDINHFNVGLMIVDPGTWTPLTDFSSFNYSIDAQVFGQIYADADGGATFIMRNRLNNDEIGTFASLHMIKYDADGNVINDTTATALTSNLDVIYSGNAPTGTEHADTDLVNLFPNMTTDGLAITDVDVTAVKEVRINFESGFLVGEDTLSYLDANSNIDGVLDANGLLVLRATGGGDMSTSDATAAINSLYYQNVEAGGTQTEGIREISITVVNTDGSLATAATYNLNVKVNDVDVYSITDVSFAAIDGGHLVDTVNIDMANLDLSDASLSGKIINVENFDLTGDGNNALTLGLDDLIDMTGPFENGYAVQSVYIDGEAGDSVILSGADWGNAVISNDGTYDLYQTADINLRIDQDITIILPDVI